jgi:DNA-binding XRE family transcriptional regulator
MITPAQIRGARAMLELSQTDLAKAAGLSKTEIGDFEMGIKTEDIYPRLRAARLRNRGRRFH